MANQLAIANNVAGGGLLAIAANYIRGEINENIRQRIGEVGMDVVQGAAEGWGSAMQEVVQHGTQVYDPSMDDVEYGAEEVINNIEEDMPQAVAGGTSGGVFYGPIVNNYAARKRWGRIRKAYKAGMFNTYLNVRWQSIGRYDNAGFASFPLWMTQESGPGIQQFANGSFTTAYTKIFFPFYVFNLTACPFGRATTINETTQAATRVSMSSIPMYQLFKDVTNGDYDWRVCYGMNNMQPNFVAGLQSGMMVGGNKNANPIDAGSAVWSTESTNGLMTGQTTASAQSYYNNVPEWDHCHTTVKAIFQGQNTRPNTIRTGVLKFTDENIGPLRRYGTLGSGALTAYDTNTVDADTTARINAAWDKYLITKHEHPLSSIKTISQRKNFHILKYDKFTIGGDVTTNQDCGAIQLRKDYVIGSQGRLRGMNDSAYTPLISKDILGTNLGIATVDAGAFLQPQKPAVTSTVGSGNSNISAVMLARAGIPAGTLTNLGGGASFPVITPQTNSTLFPERTRDRWFFIHADNFLTSKNTLGTYYPGSGTVIPNDYGPPGSDAAYWNSLDPIERTTGASIPPLSMDIVIQSKFNLRTFPDSATAV